ncbi:MAG: hypothetical protein K2N35_16865 [Muribaculaceae bacterium]|nr:hypothetical protein [Muribaculaceae bacterium]
MTLLDCEFLCKGNAFDWKIQEIGGDKSQIIQKCIVFGGVWGGFGYAHCVRITIFAIGGGEDRGECGHDGYAFWILRRHINFYFLNESCSTMIKKSRLFHLR